jgi:uncharacterized protein YndB with AHSA1/START domain
MAARKNDSPAKSSERELVITRVFDAPRELVWKAWTDPEHLMRWWGPKYFTSPACKIDLRVGGKYLFCMRSPEGKDFWSTGVYREIVEPERIVWTDSFADEKGNPVPASYYGMPGDWPEEMLVTVTFEERQGKTKLTLRHAGHPAEIGEMAEAGWNGSLDKLAETLSASNISGATTLTMPSDREIVITRVFDAPRRLVFEAISKPEHVTRWWGPKSMAMVSCEMDFRPGGAWRFVKRGPDGNDYGFRGVYREIEPPERIVQTFEFELMPGHVSVETATLEEQNGKTKLTVRCLYQSVEDRDGHYNSGMEAGMKESHDRLAELINTMK